MEKSSKNLIIVRSPLTEKWLSVLRNKKSDISDFRHYTALLSKALVLEAARELRVKPIEIETPNAKTTGVKITDDVVLIAIFRAGIPMMEQALKYFPKSRVGLFGLVREEETAIASEYYRKLPLIDKESVIFILDPMLATGGSIHHALSVVSVFRPKKIVIVSIVAAPEGVKKLTNDFPGIKIFTAALDKNLNSKKFIVPGLGDYGDRYFGTESGETK